LPWSEFPGDVECLLGGASGPNCRAGYVISSPEHRIRRGSTLLRELRGPLRVAGESPFPLVHIVLPLAKHLVNFGFMRWVAGMNSAGHGAAAGILAPPCA
jgi:hypothetical protein